MAKTIIESPAVVVGKNIDDLFSWLSDAYNFEHIMPDQVVSFKGEENRFKFGTKGLPEVDLNVIERTAPNRIVLEDSSGKIGFKLFADMKSVDESKSEVKMYFEGEFNPMMKMMVERPLKKFIEDLTDKLPSI